ncbi:hypothetical protein [Euzebyella saccharophila]|nr:hypothetical protein [Euzebyella saccharophila]MDO1498874.1 hypothetical protein [Winogradskyella maritima]
MKEVVAEIKSLKVSVSAQFNVLLGLISFLALVMTVIVFMKG